MFIQFCNFIRIKAVCTLKCLRLRAACRLPTAVLLVSHVLSFVFAHLNSSISYRFVILPCLIRVRCTMTKRCREVIVVVKRAHLRTPKLNRKR
jgi:hypothetical protein